MMTFRIQKPGFKMPACYGSRNHQKYIRSMITMTTNPQGVNKHKLSLQLDKNSLKTTSQTHLHFDRLQLQQADQIFVHNKKHEFGQFVAREALIDEEYWTAAWLRAETHWEDRIDDRFADSHRRKFTEQEFNALKRQAVTKLGLKTACIITVRKEHSSEKRTTVLKSVVGTLDVSIRPFLHGETFPGEKVKAPIFYTDNTKEPRKQYGYISNLCVAKSARRQGIARNMLHFAIESTISDGVEQVYVHVHRNNIAAQELYQKIGFTVVDLASPQLLRDKMYLLSYRP
ncbi:GCN5-related N-acetyltransferase 6, chloroplastic [Rutidosis leptorrhynchoides]|uniref:GCN5-related N-acetyltransferase 6, chloroplastic n=1 Tax=Rutidosis leptorrhynchoides TaxID=125765 RepID=UPI003A996310